jgi:hypothetical protein
LDLFRPPSTVWRARLVKPVPAADRIAGRAGRVGVLGDGAGNGGQDVGVAAAEDSVGACPHHDGRTNRVAAGHRGQHIARHQVQPPWVSRPRDHALRPVGADTEPGRADPRLVPPLGRLRFRPPRCQRADTAQLDQVATLPAAWDGGQADDVESAALERRALVAERSGHDGCQLNPGRSGECDHP